MFSVGFAPLFLAPFLGPLTAMIADPKHRGEQRRGEARVRSGRPPRRQRCEVAISPRRSRRLLEEA